MDQFIGESTELQKDVHFKVVVHGDKPLSEINPEFIEQNLELQLKKARESLPGLPVSADRMVVNVYGPPKIHALSSHPRAQQLIEFVSMGLIPTEENLNNLTDAGWYQGNIRSTDRFGISYQISKFLNGGNRFKSDSSDQHSHITLIPGIDVGRVIAHEAIGHQIASQITSRSEHTPPTLEEGIARFVDLVTSDIDPHLNFRQSISQTEGLDFNEAFDSVSLDYTEPHNTDPDYISVYIYDKPASFIHLAGEILGKNNLVPYLKEYSDRRENKTEIGMIPLLSQKTGMPESKIIDMWKQRVSGTAKLT